VLLVRKVPKALQVPKEQQEHKGQMELKVLKEI
jgi:hypothetical protein